MWNPFRISAASKIANCPECKSWSAIIVHRPLYEIIVAIGIFVHKRKIGELCQCPACMASFAVIETGVYSLKSSGRSAVGNTTQMDDVVRLQMAGKKNISDAYRYPVPPEDMPFNRG